MWNLPVRWQSWCGTPLARDYPDLDFSQVHILLLEATNRLLTGLPERLHTYTLQALSTHGDRCAAKLARQPDHLTSGDLEGWAADPNRDRGVDSRRGG